MSKINQKLNQELHEAKTNLTKKDKNRQWNKHVPAQLLNDLNAWRLMQQKIVRDSEYLITQNGEPIYKIVYSGIDPLETSSEIEHTPLEFLKKKIMHKGDK
ncbi:hypothetical protein [Tortoise microvirus 20]|nr:hypothetical protein [Tortoise microvirus 20]